jgi:hypothetical protein
MTTRQLGFWAFVLVLAYFALFHAFREPACTITGVSRSTVYCEPPREPLPAPLPEPGQRRTVV